jgi:hypothetical protein
MKYIRLRVQRQIYKFTRLSEKPVRIIEQVAHKKGAV